MNQGEHLQKGRCFSFIFERVCALVRGLSFFFRSNGLRSARARGREGCFDFPPPKKNIAKPYKDGVK